MADGYISEIKLPDNKTYLLKDSEKSDTKVVQTLTNASVEYKILLTTIASPISGNAYEAYYGENFTYNPSTSTITATKFNGKLTTTRITQPSLTGTGTTGADQGSSNTTTRYKPAVWTFSSADITPTDGDEINIKQPCAMHDYGTWLTLDGSTYYPVVQSNGSRGNWFSNGVAIKLYFDASGTASVFARGGAMSRSTITGVWRIMTSYNTNDNTIGYEHKREYPNLKAGGAIHPYSIILQLPNGKWSGITTTPPTNPTSGTISPVATGKVASTSGYRPGRILIMYARATYTDGKNIGTNNVWSAHSRLIDARYSFNLANSTGNGFTGYQPVYIVGTITDGLFYLDTNKWWTQTLPTEEDGKIYIYIGDAYDWYRLTFTEDKPMYYYKNGAIHIYTDYADMAAKDGEGNTVSSTYLKLSGGTMTDGITFVGNQSGAWNTKGILFTNGSRIGESTSGLGIYGAGSLVLRPNSGSSVDNTVGMTIDTTGKVSITKNITSSSTSTGSLVVAGGTGIAGALYVGTTAQIGKIKIGTGTSDTQQRTISTTAGYLLFSCPLNTGFVFQENAENQCRIVQKTFYPETANSELFAGSIGITTKRWNTVYAQTNNSAYYTINNNATTPADKVTLQWNSTDQSLDFVFV